MLCCPQMATKAQITAEQYLHVAFEHDAECVHGEIVERAMPDSIHSLIQFLILSPDLHHDLMEKLEEYRVWGVQNIWVVDPLSKHPTTYSETGLRYVESLSLAEYPLQLTPSALFNDL
jgi:Uma2 family endonuclease